MTSEDIDQKPSTLACNSCGSCCKNFAYIQLSPYSVKTLEDFTGMSSEEFSNNSDKAGLNRFMKFQDNGDCIFLKNEKGNYLCNVYEARSATCRCYPTTDIQNETCHLNRLKVKICIFNIASGKVEQLPIIAN